MTQSPRDRRSPSPPLDPLGTELVWARNDDESGNPQAGDRVRCPLPMSTVYERLPITPQQIAEFCQKWQIAELAVFGSILRDDFRVTGDDPSDVDFLYCLAESAKHSLFDVITMREELENLCQRNVDLISKVGIQNSRNWLRRQEILSSGMILYVQR